MEFKKFGSAINVLILKVIFKGDYMFTGLEFCVIIYLIVGAILFAPEEFHIDGIILVDSIVPIEISYTTWIFSIIFWLPIIIKNHIKIFLKRRKNG